MALEKINNPNDIKKLTPEELKVLSGEIREFLVEHLSKTGGHLASNLGSVELTMALHLLLDLPEDKIIWDVGHQSYTHKILTGRKDGFEKLRSTGGISGFPNPKESEYDAFIGGHASSSISAALGIATANEILKKSGKVVAVMGDGSLTGGMAYEALNNASRLSRNLTIVLNDNNMSISENVGGISSRLSGMRTSDGYTGLKEDVTQSLERLPKGERIVSTIRRTKSGIKKIVIPGMFFEDLDVMYLGPVDGHSVDAMTNLFKKAFNVKGPVVVHVITKKGKGFLPAERHPSRFHGIDAFDIETGIPVKKKKAGYTDVFSTVMRKLGERDSHVVAVTAAMSSGTGLKRFSNLFPERFFDVGIAEEHGITFAAGLAKEGLKPVLAIYSTFLQRGFDQVLHDICMQKLHVVLAIDRAGIVGADGETHQGVFDLSYLSPMPGMTIMAPKNKWELSDMLKFAVSYDGPIAIRYPRGEAYDGLKEARAPIIIGRAEKLYTDGDILLFALGSMVETAVKVREILREKGINAAVVNARFAKPFDKDFLKGAKERYRFIVTMEENISTGGFGEHVETYMREIEYQGELLKVALPEMFIEHGKPDDIKKSLKIDAISISETITERLS